MTFSAMSPLTLTSIGNVQVVQNPLDPAMKFKQEFMQLIQSGQYKEADDLLYRSVHLHQQLQESKAFEAMLEGILEITNSGGNSEQQYIKIVMLCRILENLHFNTEFSHLCELACLLAIGNKTQVESLLKSQNYPIGAVVQWMDTYRLLSKPAIVDLFTQLQVFMQK